MSKSKTKLAAAKPRKWIPPGFRTKLMPVATNPITVIAPNFLVHHTAIIRTVKPIKSQRKGKPVARKNNGAKKVFNTPQSAAHTDMAATSRQLKYGTSFTL